MEALFELIFVVIFYYSLYKLIKYYYIKKKRNKELGDMLSNEDNKYEIYNSYYKNNYEKKEYLLTQNEKFFYKVLKDAIKDKDIIIQTQVVLYNIIRPIKDKNFYYYFDKIKAKSIDYVLLDKDFKILLCIELDDYTHKQNNRIKRDTFINKIFFEANVKLLRIKANSYYNVDTIKELIENKLKEENT